MPTAQTAAGRKRRPMSKTAVRAGPAQGAIAERSHAFSRELVSRPALVGRLADAGDARLALIVAPPGYGKTSLVREWAQSDPRTFIWVGFEHQQSRSPELATSSIRDAFIDAGWLEPTRISALGTEVKDVGIAQADLMRCIGAVGREFVLVIEDAHELASRTLRKVVEATLSALPHGSTVAVTSRIEPDLPVGHLRAHRALVEIRITDLAMTPAEGANLLRKAGLELDFEQVQTLVRQTEGWAAALYLAALSLRDRAADGPDADAFGGDDHLLAQYLRDDVLSAVPARLSDFILRTSVLDELSGPVCDEVLGHDGSARTLAKLADVSQLLVPLDAAHERYRWHRLVGTALRSELRRRHPDAEQGLHARASDWFAASGDLDRAIGHAVAGGDGTRTSELLWPNLVAYLAQGKNDTVSTWLRSFAPERIAGCGPLALCAAHAALSAGDMAQAQHAAHLAASAIERDRGAKRDRTLTAGLVALDALVARKGAVAMRADAARAYEREPENSAWRPLFCLTLGVAEHLTGARDAARAALHEGVDHSIAPAPGLAALCLAVDAMIAIEQQDWQTATELTDRAWELVAERELAAAPMAALVFAAAAAARAHEGRADEAKQDLRTATDLLATLGDFIAWYGAETRILLAHASLWLADIIGARTLLAEASRLARKVPDAVIFERWFDEAWAYMDTLAEASMSGPSSLTIAELRILRFLPSHKSFREIAMQLGVSANTVKTQAHAVYRKLGAASRSEAVMRASEAGLLGQ
jgi:LuxR family transcriptional regulator, maltose regulon positive regulatory protein